MLAACFCRPAGGRGRSLVSQPQHAAAVVPAKSNDSAAVGDLGHCVGSERLGPKGLGPGRGWHVTG